MTSNGVVNGVIVSNNIKSEVIDDKNEENCVLFSTSDNTCNTSTITTTIVKTNESVNSNNGLYSGHNTNGRVRHDSVSSIPTINSSVVKLDFTRKSQQNSLDLYSTSGSLEPSPSSSPLSPSENHAQDMFCSSTMSGDCSSNTSIDANDAKTSDNSPKRVCLVCGDTASGFHYGVASCEACKAFFKRTIQGNIEYTCPASNDCEINKRRRKACQACRFQKCLRMGMLKEGVRLDRVRGGRQKYRRSPESPYQVQNMSPLKKSTIEENKLVAALISCEPEPLLAINTQQSNASTLSSSSSTQYKSICILSDLVDRELVATIGWAKQIPGFTDLILNDQMRLLQTTWAEVLSLSLAFRSHQLYMPSTTTMTATSGNTSTQQTKLVFANDFIMDDQQATQCRADELFSHSIQLVKRLNVLKIAKEEYLLLKAMLLTNAGIITIIEIINTVEPVYNELRYDEYPLITNHILSTNSLDFIKKWTYITNPGYNSHFLLHRSVRYKRVRLYIELFNILFTPNLNFAIDIQLEDSQSVYKLRETLLIALQECVSVLRPFNCVNHLSQILLCMPLLRQLDAVTRRYWNTIRREGNVPMNKLFVEMLESNITMR